jgi:hypothetical protein
MLPVFLEGKISGEAWKTRLTAGVLFNTFVSEMRLPVVEGVSC